MKHYGYAGRFSSTPPAPIIPPATYHISFHNDDGSITENITTSDHASIPRLIANWLDKYPFGGVHFVNS